MDKQSSKPNKQQDSGRNSSMKQDRKDSHDFGSKKDSSQCTSKDTKNCNG